MAWARELLAAVAHLSPVGARRWTFTDDETTGSLAWYPAVGVLLGLATAAASAAFLPGRGGRWAAVTAVVLLDLWPRGRHRAALAAVPWLVLPTGVPQAAVGAVGVLLAGGAWWLKLLCAARMPPPTLWAACVLGPLLARWAMVVQAHGGRRDESADLAPESLVARATFREFGVASVFTFMVALSTAQAIGLLLLLVAALSTLAVRVLVAWRRGGFTDPLIMATAELVETLVFLALYQLVVLGAQ